MILSHSKKFVYVHLYKTGGTSVRRQLERYDQSYGLFHRAKSLVTANPVLSPKVAEKHADAATIRKTIGSTTFDRYFKFAFVRNPWDLQVSMYHYVLRTPGNHNHEKLKELNSFDAYIAWLHGKQRVQSQKDRIVSREGKLLVDYVGRYESMQEDFERICAQVDIPARDLPHLNKSVDQSYRTFYTAKTEKMVGEKFSADIEYFGYDF